MPDDLKFRMPSPSAGGLATLSERSPQVDAVDALGDVPTLRKLPRVHDGDRAEARRQLAILPRTDALANARDALADALDGASAMPATVDLLISAALEVIPLPRPVRKAEYITAVKTLVSAPAPLLAGALRRMVATERSMPAIADLIAALAEEARRTERDLAAVLALQDRRDAAVCALDWNDGADRALLARVGDPVPASWDDGTLPF